MSECYLDDDGSLSGDFTVIEGVPEGVEVTPQSLWAGVRPIWHGNVPGEVMVQVCYQQAHMSEPLSGAVWITPAVWRELNAAVEWRLRKREKMSGKKKGKRCYNGCGRRVRFRLTCGPCRRKARKTDRDMRRNRRSKNAKLPGKR